MCIGGYGMMWRLCEDEWMRGGTNGYRNANGEGGCSLMYFKLRERVSCTKCSGTLAR